MSQFKYLRSRENDAIWGMNRFMIYRIVLLLCLPFTLASASPLDLDEEPYYHRVAAKAGDRIGTLLERYELDTKQCNFDQFYKLNRLNAQSRLVKDKKYYIPILIYRYNGKSIRTSLKIQTWEQALRIKKYNERIHRKKLRRSTLVRSNIIWVPHHELYCEKAKEAPEPKPEKEADALTNISPSKTTTTPAKEEQYETIDEATLREFNKNKGVNKYPVFGGKHRTIKIKDYKLRGKVFYIVAGHGGPDPGAVGRKGTYKLCEDEYAYDVCLRLVRNLIEHGAIAYMVIKDPDDGLRSGEYLPCDQDEFCHGNFKIPRNQKRRLFQRSNVINKLYERHKKQGIKDQTVVTIHIDSNNQSQQTDVFFYYFPGSRDGRQLARKLQKTLKQKYKHRKYKGTVTPRDLHMLREPKPTSVFIELGNIRNSFDQQRLILENNRQALANWLYEGLEN